MCNTQWLEKNGYQHIYLSRGFLNAKQTKNGLLQQHCLLYLRFVFIEGLYWRCVVGKDVHLYLNMFEKHFDRTQIQMWYDTNQVNKTIHYLCRPCTRVVHFMFVWNPFALTAYTNYKKTIVMIHNVTVIGTETWRRQPSVTCKQEHSVIGSS